MHYDTSNNLPVAGRKDMQHIFDRGDTNKMYEITHTGDISDSMNGSMDSSDHSLQDCRESASVRTCGTVQGQDEGPSVQQADGDSPSPSPNGNHEEEVMTDSWRGHRKHVFVLSEAGKPIYSRYGNEEALSTTMGVMMALVSFVQSSDDTIRSIHSDGHTVVFMQQGPLVLVLVSNNKQSEQQLHTELLYVHYQIVSMLTQASITRIFEQKKNYDLRRLLTGSERILDGLLDLMDTDPSFLLSAVQCLPLLPSLRDSISQILQKAITPNLVFSILIVNNQLLTIVQERTVLEDARLKATDLLLMLNFITSSSAFCGDRDAFFAIAECKRKIEENFRAQNVLDVISRAQLYDVSDVGISDLRHFMYMPFTIPEKRHQLPQFTSSSMEEPYLGFERTRLLDLYRHIHSRIHSLTQPLKIIYHVSQREVLLAWTTNKFELYACFSPFVTKSSAINSVTKLLRWIKKAEDRLFIRSPLKYSTVASTRVNSSDGRGSSDRQEAPDGNLLSLL
ncbi:vacuolar fusion protein MON1 homolog B isoform X4 [Alosa sapidissima]|uniref:vacuolar fusion protein MON1 homolog B isoform X4 n=1 Tax=Alosa sapidissima TaxID=34773 RepID=UPI001C088197|nr:vacuolar fusion protein MON1 homolog B isoform X4 [Alosa sapidissima]